MTLGATLEIAPATEPLDAVVSVPGSKSYTNRMLPAAALARGDSILSGVLDSEDTQVMMESLRRLGIKVEHDPAARTARIQGCGGIIPAKSADLHLANSGTSIRFLAAFVAAGNGTFTLDGNARMRERPIGDLAAALEGAGVAAKCVKNDGKPPLVVEACGLQGGNLSVRGDVSSQFLSALLLAAPVATGETRIKVEGDLVSKPYVDMTLAVMKEFGAQAARDGYKYFTIAPTGYDGRQAMVEPDASAASYFFGAAAIVGGRTVVSGLGTESLQGDLGFVQLLERMGCTVKMTAKETTVIGGPLVGIDCDMRHVSDTVPTLAAVACFARGTTRIRNVANARVKECDRLAAVATELSRLGARVVEHPDGLDITPGPMTGGAVDTYDDHRMAMSLSLVGLKVPGVVIRNPGCTAKTYPEFFADLATATR